MDQAIGHILKARRIWTNPEHDGPFLPITAAMNPACTDSSAKRAVSWHGQFLCQLRPLLGQRQHAVQFLKDNHEGASLRRSSFMARRYDKRLTASYGINRRMTDIMATAAGQNIPRAFADTTSRRWKAHLLPTSEDKPLDRTALYWEHVGNRAVRSGDWKLVANTCFKQNGSSTICAPIDRDGEPLQST